VSHLESPSSPDELYRYRGADIPRARPVFQGDVFRNVEIPGLNDGRGLAMITTHACTMRNGASLRPRLLMARVTPRSTRIGLPWTGNFRVMPLPDLLLGEAPGNWVATFEDLGTVGSATLDLRERIACLDDRGVVLLQQRHAHHVTRYVVETPVLYEQCSNVLAEAELLEDWIDASCPEDDPHWEDSSTKEAERFEEYFGSHREGLKDPSLRASIRRAVSREIAQRFG